MPRWTNSLLIAATLSGDLLTDAWGAQTATEQPPGQRVLHSPNFWKARPKLTIGDAAPAIENFDHWIQDGKQGEKTSVAFEPGKVYVVELWSPNYEEGFVVASFEHGRLHKEFADQDVEFLGVTSASLHDVVEFLDHLTYINEGEFYSDLLAPCSAVLAADNAVGAAYQSAACVSADAFIVGKDGRIEWIGELAQAKAPLEQVLKGSWDRAASRESLLVVQQFNMASEQIVDHARRGLVEEAEALFQQLGAAAPNSEFVKDALPALQLQVDVERFHQAFATYDDIQSREIFSQVVRRLAEYSPPSLSTMPTSQMNMLVNLVKPVSLRARREPERLSAELRDLALHALSPAMETIEHSDVFEYFRWRAPLYQHAGDLERAINDQVLYASMLDCVNDKIRLAEETDYLNRLRVLKGFPRKS